MDVSIDLPIDKDAERAVLGILILLSGDEQRRAARRLKADMFFETVNRKLYECWLDCVGQTLADYVRLLRERSTEHWPYLVYEAATLLVDANTGDGITRHPRELRGWISRLEDAARARRRITDLLDQLATEVANGLPCDTNGQLAGCGKESVDPHSR